ncbi:MAG TPA: hypothetical protein VLA79_14935 [Polyangia bacterium]|nr:hypothetical protein [Polyangia bacterium]
MRSLLLLSTLLAAATACTQSLTHDMTGTGGAATGGGAGGTGAGGSGGSNVSQLCDTLVAEYHSAISAAETCQVGASGQCQQLVTGSLTGCSCSTYVTDSSALSTIEEAWQAAGCVVPEPPCKIFCPAALNTTCVPTDGGSVGVCSYAPGTGGTSGSGGSGATGGTTGSGGSTEDGGLSDCSLLASEYAAVLAGARSCTAGAAGQCGVQVASSLSPCNSGCTEFVTDSSVLAGIAQKWQSAGCADVAVACPAIACEPASGSSCVASDAGSSVCGAIYGTLGAD